MQSTFGVFCRFSRAQHCSVRRDSQLSSCPLRYHAATGTTRIPSEQLPALDDATELTFAMHFEGSVFCPLQGLVQLLLIPFANSLLIF